MNFCSRLLSEGTPELKQILRLLRHRELSGYELANALRGISPTFRNNGDLYIYPAIHELERDGFLSSRWWQVGGFKTKYYRLTELGIDYTKHHNRPNLFKYYRTRAKQYLCKII